MDKRKLRGSVGQLYSTTTPKQSSVKKLLEEKKITPKRVASAGKIVIKSLPKKGIIKTVKIKQRSISIQTNELLPSYDSTSIKKEKKIIPPLKIEIPEEKVPENVLKIADQNIATDDLFSQTMKKGQRMEGKVKEYQRSGNKEKRKENIDKLEEQYKKNLEKYQVTKKTLEELKSSCNK